MEIKPLMDAIDRLLLKADENLEDTLKGEGYAEPKQTVEAINSLEEEVADILSDQTVMLIAAIENSTEENLQNRVDEMLESDDIASAIEEATLTMYEVQVPALANSYMNSTDGDLMVNTLRERTTAWFTEWSSQLGELTQISTHQLITSLIKNTIDKGLGIADLILKIQQGGWRSEYYQARRFALTEILRAHSVAREEAIQQSPSTDRKEWKHSGTAKIKPRENHVAMDGQIVPKNEPFVLVGADGGTYYPMFPRDPILPPGESINCHCTHRGVANDDILEMSLEERRKMQEEFINTDNEAWKAELDEKNKAKAGIDEYESSTKERAISHTNTKAAERWAKKNLGVTKTNYTKQNIKNVNKANRALQRIYKEYPELKGFVQEVSFTTRLPATTVASARIVKTKLGYRTVLRLNQTYFDDAKALDAMIKQQVVDGQWTPKRGLYGILKHEMAHMLSYRHSLQTASSTKVAWKDIMSNESAMCTEIKKEALEACNLADDYATIKEKMSEVATQDAEEFVAEAISSSRSNKLTKKVKELFEAKVR